MKNVILVRGMKLLNFPTRFGHNPFSQARHSPLEVIYFIHQALEAIPDRHVTLVRFPGFIIRLNS